MKVSKALKMAVMPWGAGKVLREEQEELARYGEVAVPGEASVTLLVGTVRAEPGEYLLSARADQEDLVEPAVLLG